MPEDQFIKIGREQLYNEIWEISVSGVAKKYNVPYTELLRLCKEIEIPIPPSGYWTKLSFGKPVYKIPLPESSLSEVILPINVISKRSKNPVTAPIVNRKVESSEDKAVIQAENTKKLINMDAYEETERNQATHQSTTGPQSLAFLTESERQEVLQAAQQIKMPSENMRMHKKIIAYKPVIKEWNKKDTKTEGAQRSLENFHNNPPFLAGVISSGTLPRVFRILDALFQQVECLGGSVNDDLSLNIRNENVYIQVIEAQDKIKHEITREEAKKLLVYEDEKRHSSWATQPNIRKYDYVFNGKLRICIRKNKYFRDSDKEKVESRLGDMLIELYEESEVVRKNREACEEKKRREEEEKRLSEEREIRYNEEIDKTIALTNIAHDYDIACKIRAYINALESKVNINNEIAAEWIDWAKKKADWFDPTVARKDELFGKRDHEENEEQKSLKKLYYW